MVNETDILKDNTDFIREELSWFETVMDTRLKLYFGNESPHASVWDIEPPSLEHAKGYYAEFIRHYQSTPAERILLMLALAPHIRPQLLDVFCVKNATYDKGFTEFGGLKGNTHSGFLPTGETLLFLLAGDDYYQRTQGWELFDPAHYLSKHSIIHLHEPGPNEPSFSGSLTLANDYVNYFISGENRRPLFSKDFPARLITTQMEWSDLVLPEETLVQIDEIKTWILHRHTLMNDWGFGKKLKPGYKSLFYGPPGTGKTLVACLLGKICAMDVYRIDLSMLVSKYIGETEKNLEKIFNLAENKNWILFFDEADALFGKRTGINDSHDRYANQETAYLLQRIEDFNGIVVLATNLKNNIDEAFSRRFQTLVYFPVPPPKERLKLWKQSFSPASILDSELDLEALAKKHELTGGMILNVIRYSSLMALNRNENIIRLPDIDKGIKKEFIKEGRLI